MEENKKQDDLNEYATLVLVKPFFFLSLQPAEIFLKFWGVDYSINPNFEFDSNSPERKQYFLIDKKTINIRVLFYFLSTIIFTVSFMVMMSYYALLIALPLIFVPRGAWSDYGNTLTLLGYGWYLTLAILVARKLWVSIIAIGIIGLVIWGIYTLFTAPASTPSLSDQMGFIIILLVFIAIGVWSKR